MKAIRLKPAEAGLHGTIHIPGDKSISHRAVMLGSIARGKTVITNFLAGADCLSTISCFQKMGVDIQRFGDRVEISGSGREGLKEPEEVLDVGNSGTTIRLMLGILASRPFHAVITGDASIAGRPMRRVTGPLEQMGAVIDGRKNGGFTPLSIRGGSLKGLNYTSPVASAQVKSAVMLAGLGAEGVTSVTEPFQSRDHTERMLAAYGVNIAKDGLTVKVSGGQTLQGRVINVPGDISSAAFFLGAGAITPDSEIILKNVGINPTRAGILEVLDKMGANLTVTNERSQNEEPVADLHIRTSDLKAVEIGGDLVPRLIDEIPMIALLATQADGQTVIKDASELKVKETNRIDTVVSQLKRLGADIRATEGGMVINGKTPLTGAVTDSFGDHRIGMMNAVASCIADGVVTVMNSDAAAVSYPDFYEDFAYLKGE
ncbi:3-phosphoshikimate 1-carboxyvinyltransferase [Bacillus marinisedimentorum]|uniref:3-phosphoshikimate 1-carboxyvinyltransferase n=1 Tax=Bacillus marinisedimentorum TaxID=1821260 RepID=UPI000D092F63|nr:3-phosphoshikimate 1-carboxyvinyltransferase [Bacillus marinisedimentorum]